MRQYLIYLAVPVLLGMLCILSGGGLGTAAGWLMQRIPGLGKAADKATISKAMLFLLIIDFVAALTVWSGGREDTAAEGYLLRGEYGSGAEKEALDLELGGETHRIELDVDAVKLSQDEIQALLQSAAAEAEAAALDGQDAGHVDRALVFKESLADGKVQAEWMTSEPAFIDWNGNIGDVPADGADVTLCAGLRCEEEMLEKTFSVRVYPPKLEREEQLAKDVKKIISETNSDTADRVTLPAEVNGEKAKWSFSDRSSGTTLLFMGIVIAVFYLYAGVRKRTEAEEKRREEMLLDYPHIVSRIVLLNTAGLSMRKSFERLRRDYAAGIAAGAPKRPGYDEIVRTCVKMDHGMPEQEAYADLGKRTGLAEYRTFSSLLVENLTKGGDGIGDLLRKEAVRAFDGRRKQASAQGAKAGTKLLMPMMMLLAVVMAILMTPAILSFL